MRWVRLDLAHKLRDPEPFGDCRRRVYGLEGAMYPRLVLSVYRSTRYSHGTTPSGEATPSYATLTVSCEVKYASGQWWGSYDMPAELLPDLIELLQEAPC